MDDDNKAYVYFGGLWGGQLEKWQTGTYDPDGEGPAETEPALGPIVAELNDDMLTFKKATRNINCLMKMATLYLLVMKKEGSLKVLGFINIMEYYYLSYSTGTTHCIVYAISKNPKVLMFIKVKYLTQF